jgi:adenylate kinase family enzyme
MDYQRIAIVGKSGSGKTTLGRQLAEILSLKHVELDAIHWQPNWVQLEKPKMWERVDDALPVDGHWVADGNYSVVREIVWGRADTLIWLDYGLLFTLWRLFRRTFGRLVLQKRLWNGNRETLANQLTLDTTNNLFLFAIGSHSRHREQFPLALKEERYSHLRVLRFRKSSEVEEWVKSLTRSRFKVEASISR